MVSSVGAPAPGTRWLHKRDKSRVCVVVRVKSVYNGGTANGVTVDYRYESTVGGMGSNRSTPVQSMDLSTWLGIFTLPAPGPKSGAARAP